MLGPTGDPSERPATSESDAAETEIFDFEIFVHTVLRAFAPDTGFFYAAEGRDLRGNDSGIDTDDAVFEGFSDAPHAGNVTTVEISGQAKFGVVREGDGVGFRLEPEERRDGTEGFFARDKHLRRDAGKN